MTDKDFEFITDKIGIWFANLKLKSFRHTFDGDTYPSSALVTDYELFVAKLKKDIKFIPEEPVSEDLDEAAREDAKIERSDDSEVGYDLNRYSGFVAGAKWQKQQIMKDAIDCFIGPREGWFYIGPLLPQHYYNLEKDEEIKMVIIKE